MRSSLEGESLRSQIIEGAQVSAQVVRGQHLQPNDRSMIALTNSQQQQSLRRMLGSMCTGTLGVAGPSHPETSQMICGGLPINYVPTIFELRPPVADALRCVRN